MLVVKCSSSFVVVSGYVHSMANRSALFWTRCNDTREDLDELLREYVGYVSIGNMQAFMRCSFIFGFKCLNLLIVESAWFAFVLMCFMCGE